MKQRMHKLRCAPRWAAALVLAGLSASMLTGMASQIRIYRVTDGSTSATINSFEDDYEKIRDYAGFGGDGYEITAVSTQGDVMTELTVEEKFLTAIHVDGETIYLSTVSGSVEDIVNRAGVKYDSDDKFWPAPDAHIDGQTEITLTRVRSWEQTETEAIAFSEQTRYNRDLDYGVTRVVQQGINGEKALTYRVTAEDGEEVSRELISETVTAEPVTQIVEIGTAGAVTTAGGDVLRYSKVINVTATAYSGEEASGQRTAIGTKCRVGAIAVDPRVIPLGSRLYITSADGTSWVYGTAVAEDTGGAIKGNRIDLFYNTTAECNRFGRRAAKVYILS